MAKADKTRTQGSATTTTANNNVGGSSSTNTVLPPAKTMYANVIQESKAQEAKTTGRLILSPEKLMYDPEISSSSNNNKNHNKTNSSSNKAFKVSWTSIAKHMVSTKNNNKLQLKLLNHNHKSLVFTMANRADLERIRLDISQRLGYSQKKTMKKAAAAAAASGTINVTQEREEPYGQILITTGNTSGSSLVTFSRSGGAMLHSDSSNNLDEDRTERTYHDWSENATESNLEEWTTEDVADNNIMTNSIHMVVETNLSPKATMENLHQHTLLLANMKSPTSNSSNQIITAKIPKQKGIPVDMHLGYMNEDRSKLFITKIDPKGMASQTKLKVDMQVLSINQESCTNMRLSQAAKRIQDTDGMLTIVARHSPPPPEQNNVPGSLVVIPMYKTTFAEPLGLGMGSTTTTSTTTAKPVNRGHQKKKKADSVFVVTSIQPGSVAAACHDLQIGMIIRSVNNIPLQGRNPNEVFNILNQQPPGLVLLLAEAGRFTK